MAVRTRCTLRLTVGSTAVAFGVFAAVRPDWIEVVFHVGPDGGSGAVEWAIAVAPLAVGVALVVAALFDLVLPPPRPEQ